MSEEATTNRAESGASGSEASVWSAMLASISRHRFAGALFYKPVCLIAAIDCMRDGVLDPASIDAAEVMARFRIYVGVNDPERAEQGWRPLWHLSNDGIWSFSRDGRLVTGDVFGMDRSPRTQGQLLASFDNLAISDPLRSAWCDPAALSELRLGLLRILTTDNGDARTYARQLWRADRALHPAEWPSQSEVDQALQVTREQLDLFGAGTGVEIDDSTSEQSHDIRVPFDPEEIDVVTKPMTVDLMLSRVRHGMIDLQADFQRRWGIWDQGRQSRLIESLLLRIPLPVIYAAEDKDERWEIVDGIQRLSTIARFISPEIIGLKPLVLTGLNALRAYNGKRYDDLSERLKLRLREAELTVHLIRRGTPARVKYNIFARINTGGVALSAQELRHAITPGPVRGILEEWSGSPSFLKATDGSIRSIRMDDRELVLRFLAFRLLGTAGYRQPDMDAFLISAMERINALTGKDVAEELQAFTAAMDGAYAIFSDDAFRKRTSALSGRRPINKALFEAVAVGLAELDANKRAALVERREKVRSAFMQLCADRSFEDSITQGTGDIAKVRRRFSAIAKLLEDCAAAC